MKKRSDLRHWILVGAVLSVVVFAVITPALAEVKIANVREYEMRRRIERGANVGSEVDDTYPQLGEGLKNVVGRGIVMWGDRDRMEKASLVKVKIQVPDRDVLRAFGVEEAWAVKEVVDQEDGTGWATLTLEPGNGTEAAPVILRVDNDGSMYQMITDVAIKVDGEFRRLPLNEKGYGAYAITQNYFSHLAESGKLNEWVASTLKPEGGVTILAIRADDRRRTRELFDPSALARPDRAYVIIAQGREAPAEGGDYEIVFGWQQRKLSLGGGGLSVSPGGDSQFTPHHHIFRRWLRGR